MRIAVTYEEGEISPYFGCAEQFKFYDIEGSRIVAERVADVEGEGHGALVEFLAAAEADALICGGIGSVARQMLADEGIAVYGGVEGDADISVSELMEGTLEYDM